MKKDFAKALREKRLKLGYTLKELSIKSGVSISLINYYEHGRYTPRPATRLKLEKALNTDQGYFSFTSHLPSDEYLKKMFENIDPKDLTYREKSILFAFLMK
ncbi:MAG: helix-turn-helix transcriptional regulator [Cyclobacteriaceae bacterium]|jgi:transcriptional regulator with XRE-family HTH domain|nr:helix-turn-helix transcriptional regulator [Cytophagales bacterium]MCZ8327786.1 helix-turn-helix transcriptional regulator [Cyclobacteriaceae bacterium]